jgi:hypothetical protein
MEAIIMRSLLIYSACTWLGFATLFARYGRITYCGPWVNSPIPRFVCALVLWPLVGLILVSLSSAGMLMMLPVWWFVK